jgi:hypothetical protein
MTVTASCVLGATIPTILQEDQLAGTEEGSPETEVHPAGVPAVSVPRLGC